MGMRLKYPNGILGLTLSSLGIATAIFLQVAPSRAESQQFVSIPEAFEDAFFQSSKNFFQNRTIWRQIDLIFGPGSLYRSSYPEIEIERDAKRIENLYRRILKQQVSSAPVIRTPDLPNPYDTSILQQPPSNFTNQFPGIEFNFERNTLR
ncbi:MAG: hypothetical protein N3E45_00285 [Oscillatoriaceae bacterium SKW80]|nr:hypothetical protein [Oscillatoriaceae bacterium SKYG93]MCX8119266.1 hypothetical protein [Oscillatoriaceae bacterium SKW80]MDW8454733.1 hypothetical protein [Oscillatoriaceae cyanobacterium SKYGB_i_bin93]HIK28487.1 hypothetical protein [Oscillatoriaceae cyanobacterium M7585_C2015_266]